LNSGGISFSRDFIGVQEGFSSCNKNQNDFVCKSKTIIGNRILSENVHMISKNKTHQIGLETRMKGSRSIYSSTVSESGNRRTNHMTSVKSTKTLDKETYKVMLHEVSKSENSSVDAELLERAFQRSVKQTKDSLDSEMIESLFESHRRMILVMARKLKSVDKYRLPESDLIQEGTLGLLHAASKFDASRNFRFSTYATPWVRHYMRRAEENCGTLIRIPVHLRKEANSLVRAAMRLRNKVESSDTKGERAVEEIESRHFFWPSVKDLAKFVNRSEDYVAERIQYLRSGEVVSLDAYIDETEQTKTVASQTVDVSVSESRKREERLAALLELMKSELTQVEFDAVCYKFGLLNNDPHTLKEVSLLIGVSAPHVHRVVQKALAKLRKHEEMLIETIFH